VHNPQHFSALIESTPPTVAPLQRIDFAKQSAFRTYLEQVMSNFQHVPLSNKIQTPPDPKDLLNLLTGRDFCYLSKTKVAPYREQILHHFAEAIRNQEPLRFYYDIGGGYHATAQLGEALSFHVGLGELLILNQIARFARAATTLYAPGVRFSLVVDNMCALLINDIPLNQTLEYCRLLRRLIFLVELDRIVDVMVESEHVSVADFERHMTHMSEQRNTATFTDKHHDNVERFLGWRCSELEAKQRASKYTQVVTTAEQLLLQRIHGVHMTQRATGSTICFRPFPGGDSRIQCGEVALTLNPNHKVQPVLLTTRNVKNFLCQRHELSDLLPEIIPHVTYAEHLAT
jgi:hypothetical protein